MKLEVQKWGNSLALRIPKPFAEEVAVREGTIVDLRVSKGRIVMKPLTRKKPALHELLAKVAKANLHGEHDTGRSIGRESW